MQSKVDWESEFWALTEPEGLALLAEAGEHPTPLPADLVRWRRTHSPERVSAAIRLAEGRRRGLAKFTRAGSMWMDPVGLEQSTSEVVARWKARRFAGQEVTDFCSGLGGDAIAFAEVASRVVALDADPGMTRRLKWNAEVYGVQERLIPILGRVEHSPIGETTLVHVDPDRRPVGSTRVRSVENYSPGLEQLLELSRTVEGGAFKVSPISDFDEHFSGAGFEVELISLKGECKEATVWFGSLAGCRKRASCLPAGATWTDRDTPAGLRPRSAEAPLAWFYDPDPTLDRSSLLDGFAGFHGLSRIGTRRDALTSADRVDSPFLAAFEVIEVLPFDRKLVRAWLAEREIGEVEIKPRGVAIVPATLRQELKPHGPGKISMFLIEAPRGRRAVMARRVGAP
ncbi:class I SAM-dependent methyltransferase [Isosphaeraceae bacterium EP7]